MKNVCLGIGLSVVVLAFGLAVTGVLPPAEYSQAMPSCQQDYTTKWGQYTAGLSSLSDKMEDLQSKLEYAASYKSNYGSSSPCPEASACVSDVHWPDAINGQIAAFGAKTNAEGHYADAEAHYNASPVEWCDAVDDIDDALDDLNTAHTEADAALAAINAAINAMQACWTQCVSGGPGGGVGMVADDCGCNKARASTEGTVSILEGDES